MSEHSWVLKGVDAETRQKAVEEAERRGVSLADYLTDVVLQGALAEQLLAPGSEADDADYMAPESYIPAPPQENFAVRHRLEALERRVGLAVGGLDSAVHSLDSSVFGLAARIDEAEILAADTADTLSQALAETGANLAALRKRLADAEDHTGALSEALEATRTDFADSTAGLHHRIDSIEDAARAANTSAAQLAVAHEALKYAVADDFSAFARESAARLSTGLDEVRAAADSAAEQAEIAVGHLINELRTMRESVEARQAEGAAETRLRVQAAFAEATERLNGLADRVTENERLTVRTAEQLRAQISDVEDGAQTALEETAESLRQAGAALAAEVARTAQDQRTALESVHADLTNEIAELRERQSGGLARLKLVDSAVANTISEVATLRQDVEASNALASSSVRAVLTQAQSDWDARFDAFAARLANSERNAAEAHQTLHAETARVEACTFAALEKLAADRIAGDELLERRLDQHVLATEGLIEQVRQRLDIEIGDMRDLQSGALARLKLIDAALGSQNGDIAERLTWLETELANRAIDRGFDERILRLEAAAENTQTEHALAALRGQVAGLAAQLDATRTDETVTQRIEELRNRIAAYESQGSEAADRVHGVARMLGRLTAQNADAATQSEERLHKLELAMADLRLEHLSGDTAPASDNAAQIVHALEQRVVELEERQAEAFEALRIDIAHFIGENTRRLEALENTPSISLDTHDVASEFETLRQRIEDRLLGVEQRSVRALEQVADTMAVLEKRFMHGPEAVARSA